MASDASAPLLLDETEAEKFSGINKYTLREFRRERRGPVLVKIGRAVRYRPEDLTRFVNAHRVAPKDLPPVQRREAAPK